MRINDAILISARAALTLQQPHGAFPPGCNGPYGDPETPVCNTSHWLIVLCRAYELSGDKHLKEAAWQAARYLASSEARPMGATFFCRKNPQKDFSNGLIGQAWTIESLVLASRVLQDACFHQVAEEVFLLHPFDEQLGLWRRVNVDGSYSTPDMTFNHQLWFAAAGSLLETDPDTTVGAEVARFLDQCLTSHLGVSRSGRIIHRVRRVSKKRRIAQAVDCLRRPIQAIEENIQMVHKEIGYQAFNLYAFSILKRRMPAHPLWHSDKLLSALQFVTSAEYASGLENNRFGYPYNPPGIEVPFALFTFDDQFSGDIECLGARWLSQQFARTFDLDGGLMQKNTDDPDTLAARIYEATRLPNLPISVATEF